MKTLSITRLLAVAALTLALFACSLGTTSPGTQPPVSAPEGQSSDNPVSAGQITVSGMLNKTYPAVNVSIGQFGPARIRLYMNEDTPADLSRVGDALTFDFPSDIQPGTYDIPNSIGVDLSTIDIWATYGTTDGMIANFQSVSGTLTITAIGATYSGQFEFTAAKPDDTSVTITVTGSFAELQFNQ